MEEYKEKRLTEIRKELDEMAKTSKINESQINLFKILVAYSSADGEFEELDSYFKIFGVKKAFDMFEDNLWRFLRDERDRMLMMGYRFAERGW